MHLALFYALLYVLLFALWVSTQRENFGPVGVSVSETFSMCFNSTLDYEGIAMHLLIISKFAHEKCLEYFLNIKFY